MSFTDFLFIYLSIGAPLAVYFFLQNKNRLNSRQLWLKTILEFIFWIPYAFRLFKNYLRKAHSETAFAAIEISDSPGKKLLELQRKLENSITETGSDLTLFEIREIFDRYTGLTLELKDADNFEPRHANEIFNISANKNSEIASLCNQRRNLKRLSFHQKLASNDFVDLISDIYYQGKLTQTLYSRVLEITGLLKDSEMQNEIEKMFAREMQTSEDFSVIESEKDLWKTEQVKPLETAAISMSFPTMKTTTNLRSKD